MNQSLPVPPAREAGGERLRLASNAILDRIRPTGLPLHPDRRAELHGVSRPPAVGENGESGEAPVENLKRSIAADAITEGIPGVSSALHLPEGIGGRGGPRCPAQGILRRRVAQESTPCLSPTQPVSAACTASRVGSSATAMSGDKPSCSQSQRKSMIAFRLM